MVVLGANKLTFEDASKILEPFSREQLLEIVQNAIFRHIDVLDAVRSIADRDPTQRKLFVRGLGWETTTDKLRSIFLQYGDLEEAIVILDKVTGKSKDFGFVTFKHIDGAMQALKEPSKKIDGRMTVTQLAAAGISGWPGGGGGNNPVDVSLRKIYVGNVPYDMPAERLLSHFAMYGEIEEGPLGFDKATGKSKGFALFVYKTAEAARASLVDPTKNIDGHQLNCKLAIDGKKGKPGAVGPGGAQGTNEGHADGIGARMPDGIQNVGHGGGGGASGYTGFSGPSPLGGSHLNSALGSAAGAGAGATGFSGVGSQLVGSALGGGAGFASGLGGPYGSGSRFGGLPSSGYGGLGGPGLGASGGHGAGGGLGVAGNELGSGRGSSLYSLSQNSCGFPGGDFSQSSQYNLPSSGYQSQHHQPAGTSPVPIPSVGMYSGMPSYY